MSKRPHDDVDETEEDFDQQFYTGGTGRRRVEVATHLATMGLRSGVVLPMPVFFQAPYAGTVCPGTEALRFASLATVVHSFQVPSSPAAGAASSIDAAVQDDTASGQDTAPVPDRGTASRQDAAPIPNRDMASGQDELETRPGSAHDGSASEQISADQGVEMPREEAPPQDSTYPQNRQVVDRKGYHWRHDNMWQTWMWWDSGERNWMWHDDDGRWYPNWQPPRRWRNDGERNWSARETWRESSWGSMEE